MKTNKLLLIACCITLTTYAQNTKPFVIPEIREWNPSNGYFVINTHTRIINSKQTLRNAMALANDFKTMHNKSLKCTTKSINNNVIRMCIDTTFLKNKGNEAYRINIDKAINITANSDAGVYHATRTILQLAEQSDSIPCGTITDYPDYPVRGFMLDVGRKFFSLSYLRNIVRLMAYYKMNTFQIHLNDNGFRDFYNNNWDSTYAAFRLQSDTYPGLAAKDGHYSKNDFRKFQIEALKQGVTIIPEIDAPAHTLAFTHFKPDIGSKTYGMDHLDLFNPATYDFLNALYKEYLGGKKPVFVNPWVHIGTDEYSNKDTAVVEKFRYFTDYYIRYIESFGKKAVLWGALTHAKGKTPVKAKDVLMGCWYNGYANPRDMINLGYNLLSIPDGLVYIVPAAGYYYDYLNIRNLYNNWTPAVIGKEVFDEKNPHIKGGMFAVWNDHPGNGISYQDVYHRIVPAMQTMSAKMWDGKNTTLSFDEFDKGRSLLSEAPGLNMLARPAKGRTGTLYVLHKPQKGKTLKLPLNDIGYNYRVSFDLQITKNPPKGSPLFSSDNATVYLSDPIHGNLGFARDGYNYHFNYKVPGNQKCRISVEGTNKATRLFVNGNLIEELGIIPNPADIHNAKKRKWVQTLVFPLKKLHHFSGTLENLTVEAL